MLQHVSLELDPSDVERTIEFWRLLGFAQVPAPEQIAPYVTWLERGGTQIHLIHTSEPAIPPLGHAAVHVEAFEPTLERLREAGYEVQEADELWGASRCFAEAPGRHRVELMASPPPPGGGRSSD